MSRVKQGKVILKCSLIKYVSVSLKQNDSYGAVLTRRKQMRNA